MAANAKLIVKVNKTELALVVLTCILYASASGFYMELLFPFDLGDTIVQILL